MTWVTIRTASQLIRTRLSVAGNTVPASPAVHLSRSCVGVRVWGVVDDRLVELVAGPGDRFEIRGLPHQCSRTTEDRVRAALINVGLFTKMPSTVVDLRPAVWSGATSDLDLAVALALLARAGVLDRTSWIFAVGRLGLDGTIHAPGLDQAVTVADAVRSMSDP